MSEKKTIQKEKQLELENYQVLIEEFKQESKRLSRAAQIRLSFELEKLEEKWQTAKDILEKFGNASGNTLEEVTKTFETAWEDLISHFKKMVDFSITEGLADRECLWEIYQDHTNQWRWRMQDPDGRIVGSSHKGYSNRYECVANASRHGYED